MNELESIVSRLLDKYKLKYIFLIGSRAKKNNTPNSDFDIIGFCEQQDFRLSGDYFYINNNFIDLSIYKEETLTDISSFIQARPEFIDGVRLYGNQVEIDLILEKVKEEYKKGPKIFVEDKVAAIAWLRRIIFRLKNEQLDILYNYRFQRYSVYLLSTYFWVRGLWFHCPKTAFKWLEENDFEAYKIFKKIYQNSPDINHLERLIELIVNKENKIEKNL